LHYTAEISEAAFVDAENYLRFLCSERQEPAYAERWWNGLIDAMLSLETMPRRCPLIPERKYFKEELRHLIYQSHRIIFTVTGNKVTVVRIYHGAQQPLK
jgi:plasmid stabilization system protein ParE